DAQGNLIYVSRKDFQIKHLGHRIELGEIETDAMACDGVTRACCIYDSEKKKLVLFYTGDRDKKELEKDLRTRLPDFMVPNRTIQIDRMPLNKNGKIDRHALMDQYHGGK
ncbi:MAG: D-alanine--poly(phosphoribitol) ligase, partial [Firmicutes bacterium]|nr:D-alanine--poly(phosphoribitol) ligase [Bacillota bacterium]